MAQQKYTGFEDWDRYTGVREQCTNEVGGHLRDPTGGSIAECIYENLNELSKATLAARSYNITLWPAFVAIIASLGSDPYYMVYDNIWWAALFSLTCTGMPGLANERPAHHLEVLTTRQGRLECEGWKYNPDRPRIISKSFSLQTMGETGNYRHDRNIAYLEWMSLFVAIALYTAFSCLFPWSLKDSAVTFTTLGIWMTPAVWWFISASPAVWGVLSELVLNRIELFEPSTAKQPLTETTLPRVTSPTRRDTRTMVVNPKDSPTQPPTTNSPRYVKSATKSSLHLFIRIAYLQWTRAKFRILIKPRKQNIYVAINECLTALGRVTVFAIASVSMGNILLMPIPYDSVCFVLLLLTAAMPRFIWPVFWRNGARGADLVVWVTTVRGMDET